MKSRSRGNTTFTVNSRLVSPAGTVSIQLHGVCWVMKPKLLPHSFQWARFTFCPNQKVEIIGFSESHIRCDSPKMTWRWGMVTLCLTAGEGSRFPSGVWSPCGKCLSGPLGGHINHINHRPSPDFSPHHSTLNEPASHVCMLLFLISNKNKGSFAHSPAERFETGSGRGGPVTSDPTHADSIENWNLDFISKSKLMLTYLNHILLRCFLFKNT